MIDFMDNLYDYLKAFHLIAAFAWMAGMFYLPRLFVYHAEAGVGTPQAETFKVMERRLLKFIMNPAMIVTVVIGLWLAFGAGEGQWSSAGWLHAKLLLVVLMLGLHGMLGRWRREFAEDRIPHNSKFFRFANEVPTLLLVGIVILAVVKPF